MKFGQLIEYSKKNIFVFVRKIFLFKNHAEREPGRLVPDLFLFFQNALYEI